MASDRTAISPPEVRTDLQDRYPDIILVLLESVGYREIHQTLDGEPLMPNLAGIARKELSFSRFIASGEATTHAIFSVFSGLPARSADREGENIWSNASGFPFELKRAGYDTVFINESDLNFGAWRQQILPGMGFREIVEINPVENIPVWGWGVQRRCFVPETDFVDHNPPGGTSKKTFLCPPFDGQHSRSVHPSRLCTGELAVPIFQRPSRDSTIRPSASVRRSTAWRVLQVVFESRKGAWNDPPDCR